LSVTQRSFRLIFNWESKDFCQRLAVIFTYCIHGANVRENFGFMHRRIKIRNATVENIKSCPARRSGQFDVPVAGYNTAGLLFVLPDTGEAGKEQLRR
jgi:hypothetical protein